MQFHHHGYVRTDPRIQPAAGVGLDRPEELPDEMDVLVVGTGPAGAMTAAQLSQFPDVHTRIIERRPHRLELGQADALQARSFETFQAFGFGDRLMAEAHLMTSRAFWKPDVDNPAKIVRSAIVPDDPMKVSEFPHMIVNQARVLDYFIEYMAQSPSRMVPDYGVEFVGLEVTGDSLYPVSVRVRHTAGRRAGEVRTVRAKYVVGSDGARSSVRKSIGRRLEGDQANHGWGVMDVLATTDFPDVRLTSVIQSQSAGNILLIPREGGHLIRIYVDLGEVRPETRAEIRATTVEDKIARAQVILRPYSLQVKDVAWSSVYEVGHRLADKFDDVPDAETGSRTPRVFITGDACHTHSAKAGQGMNVSMQDGFNLAWKLGYVLTGRSPETLLDTYSAERHVVAEQLIAFDKEWSSMLAKPSEDADDAALLEDFYVRRSEFPAGFMTHYAPSVLTGAGEHQGLATGFPIGKRFRSAYVTRVCDTNPIHLGHEATADGRWRLYAFADSLPAVEDSPLRRWADWLATSPDSPVVRFTRAGRDTDAVFDVKVVFQQPHADVSLAHVPRIFLPTVGPFELTDYEKIFAVDTERDIFAERQIARQGAVVVVRPDQYVANVLPLSDHGGLASFFESLLLEPQEGPGPSLS